MSDYDSLTRSVDYESAIQTFIRRRNRDIAEKVSRAYGLPLELLEDQSHIERGEN